METMRPTLKRGRESWDKVNMPESEFQERLQKIRKQMKKEGLDVLLLYGIGPDHYGDVCYASNFVIRMAQFGAIVAIPQNGQVVLFCGGGSRELPNIRRTTWVEQIKPGNSAEECIKYLKENNFIPSTIGLVGLKQLMPYYQLQYLLEAVGQCKIVDFDHIMRSLRAVKSQRESDQIRRSSYILNLAFDHIANNPIPDMNEKVLAAILDKVVRLEGVEDCRILVAMPQEEKWAFRPAQDTPISTGKTVFIYLAVEFEGYWSEVIRTFVAESNHLIQPKLDNIQASYEGMIRRMKPGKTLSQFYKEVISELRKSGTDYFLEYGLGQGIGLGLQEFPMIAEDETSQLCEGMCLTLRLAVNDKEMGAIIVGNTVHLSEHGLEVLTGKV